MIRDVDGSGKLSIRAEVQAQNGQAAAAIAGQQLVELGVVAEVVRVFAKSYVVQRFQGVAVEAAHRAIAAAGHIAGRRFPAHRPPLRLLEGFDLAASLTLRHIDHLDRPVLKRSHEHPVSRNIGGDMVDAALDAGKSDLMQQTKRGGLLSQGCRGDRACQGQEEKDLSFHQEGSLGRLFVKKGKGLQPYDLEGLAATDVGAGQLVVATHHVGLGLGKTRAVALIGVARQLCALPAHYPGHAVFARLPALGAGKGVCALLRGLCEKLPLFHGSDSPTPKALVQPQALSFRSNLFHTRPCHRRMARP